MSKKFITFCCTLIWILLEGRFATGEVFTAIVDVYNLVDAEKKIIDVLQNVTVDQQKMVIIKSYINEFTTRFARPNTDLERLISHPLNAFRLVKHLSINWEDLMRYIEKDLSVAVLKKLEVLRGSVKYPGDEDIVGAAEGFVRLQTTYKIETETFASGKIAGVSPALELDTFDCFIVGHRLARQGILNYAISWLELARSKFRLMAKAKHLKMHEMAILDWLVYSHHHSRNILRAHELLLEQQAIHPAHPGLEDNIKNSRNLLDKMTVAEIETMRNHEMQFDFGDENEALCRGEKNGMGAVGPKLRCFYITHNNPFLLLQPAKYELVHINPEVFIVHDVVLSSQLERIKVSATEFLQRSKVAGAGQTKIRISKSAFLDDDTDPVIKTVNTHLGHITNFDMNQAELLQVVNYGIGGFYKSHFDYYRNPTNPHPQHIEPRLGDRIATVLVYMTDVEAGGATIFPLLDLAVFPEKGSAVFWFNLHRDGQGDLRTLHEGCPVLSGSKWVFNKWIREVGQDKARPCDLKSNSGEIPTWELVDG